MKLVIFQFEPNWQDTQASLHRLIELFEKQFAARKSMESSKLRSNSCLVVLPELFSSGFSMHPEVFAEMVGGEVGEQLSQLAKRYHLEIIAGVAQKQDKAFANCALWVDSNGQLKAHYQKQKLFRFAGEHKIYRPGEKPVSISLFDFLQASLFICYDLRFPELFRSVAKQSNMAVVIANWPQTRRMHWKVLLQARAIENQMWVLGVNRIGEDGNNLVYSGGSVLFNPKGDLVFDAKQSPIFEFELNLEQMLAEVSDYRSEFPVLKDV